MKSNIIIYHKFLKAFLSFIVKLHRGRDPASDLMIIGKIWLKIFFFRLRVPPKRNRVNFRAKCL